MVKIAPFRRLSFFHTARARPLHMSSSLSGLGYALTHRSTDACGPSQSDRLDVWLQSGQGRPVNPSGWLGLPTARRVALLIGLIRYIAHTLFALGRTPPPNSVHLATRAHTSSREHHEQAHARARPQGPAPGQAAPPQRTIIQSAVTMPGRAGRTHRSIDACWPSQSDRIQVGRAVDWPWQGQAIWQMITDSSRQLAAVAPGLGR